MTHKPHAALNAPPGEAHLERIDASGLQRDADGYALISYEFKGKIEKMRLDRVVFIANMLREPRGGDLIHVDGRPENDAFSNLQEALN
jgi:hypothetical protein